MAIISPQEITNNALRGWRGETSHCSFDAIWNGVSVMSLTVLWKSSSLTQMSGRPIVQAARAVSINEDLSVTRESRGVQKGASMLAMPFTGLPRVQLSAAGFADSSIGYQHSAFFHRVLGVCV
jgi:hypothetical protein